MNRPRKTRMDANQKKESAEWPFGPRSGQGSPTLGANEVRLGETISSCLAAPNQNPVDTNGKPNRMELPLLQAFLAIDGPAGRRYSAYIISPVASVAGREAGSNGSASAFSGRAA